jgi:hypothetical protein
MAAAAREAFAFDEAFATTRWMRNCPTLENQPALATSSAATAWDTQ